MKATLFLLFLSFTAFSQTEMTIQFIGDKSTKTFYLATCQEVDTIKLENRKFFINKTETENEGYTEAKCTPAKTPAKSKTAKAPPKQVIKAQSKYLDITSLYSIETNPDKYYGKSFYIYGDFGKFYFGIHTKYPSGCNPDIFEVFTVYGFYDVSKTDKHYYLLVDDLFKPEFESYLHKNQGQGDAVFRAEFSVKNGDCYGLKIIKPYWVFDKHTEQ